MLYYEITSNRSHPWQQGYCECDMAPDGQSMKLHLSISDGSYINTMSPEFRASKLTIHLYDKFGGSELLCMDIDPKTAFS